MKFRKYIKVLLLLIIALMIIICLISYFFKPTYSVTLNGDFIGYTQNKSGLQAKINEAIQKGDGENLAFVQIPTMPEYKLCLLKKKVKTNEEEIYSKIVNQGTPYYKYYAILEDGEEKFFVSNFEEAEEVVKELKEKKSTNSEKISVLEKYDTEKEEFTEKEVCVSKLYKKPTSKKTKSSSSAVPPKSVNTGAKVELGIGLIRPVVGNVTSRFGSRWGKWHKGLDIGASKGTTIVAAASGTVTVSQVGYSGGYGNYIILSHENGVETVYAHCTKLLVGVGQYVSQGQAIATVGSTGRSTGNHLHFEIRKNGIAQNPQNYLY